MKKENIQDGQDGSLALISEVRDGDQSAFGKLLHQYTPLVDSMISKYAPEYATHQDREDLRQDALVVFYNAIMSYDMGQSSVSFGLYAKICIGNCLISSARAMQRRNSGLAGDYKGTESAEGDAESDLSSRIIQDENYRALYSYISRNLSDYENRVWWMYVSGSPAKLIAEKLSKDERSVSNAIYRIRRKLRGLLK